MKFTKPENFAFDRTEILVELFRFGSETLISRSQAKRISRGLDKFRHVTLDFKGVRLVGQEFVDEIFRVYLSKHKDIQIDYINANDDILLMIKRSKSS